MPSSTRLQRRLIGSLSLLSLHFGRWLKCEAPVPSKLHSLKSHESKENLFVLLPGIQDRHLEFELAGFVLTATKYGLDADLLAVDAHIGYYARETILARLHEDVIGHAKSIGYKNIWLLGTSLGGLGSALYAQHFGADIKGVVLLAPFLGNRALIDEIYRAGGPQNWDPHPTPQAPEFQIELWRWLINHIEGRERQPRIFLGYGDRDRFAPANSLLARLLPREQVHVVKGGHDWKTWRNLWEEILRSENGAFYGRNH